MDGTIGSELQPGGAEIAPLLPWDAPVIEDLGDLADLTLFQSGDPLGGEDCPDGICF